MQHPRKKMTRRELKQDKFIIATLKAKDFLEKNSKLVVRGVLVVIIIAAIIIFFIRSKQAANADAATLLGQVQFMMNSGRQESAIDSLDLIIDRYDGTEAAGRAAFLLGKLYWEKNDYDNAKSYFEKYIDDYMDETVVSQSALAGYADCLLKETNYEEAGDYYERASKINSNNPENPEFLFSAAAAYKDAGKIDKAHELAEKLITDYQNTQVKNKAEILLEDLKLAKS